MQTAQTDHLLAFALARPHDAITAARAVLADRPSPYEASIARQAAGIGLRQIGQSAAAIRELRSALRLARASGERDREVDVLATLGATLGRAGRGREGLAALELGIRHSRGALAGRILLRRADVLLVLGRYPEALADLRGAVTRLRRAGDVVWEARSRQYRGFVHLALGATTQADKDLVLAERLFAESGQDFEYAQATNNRGLLAFARGDLPTALAFFDEAGRRFAALGMFDPDLAIDRCAVLLAAGLAEDAFREADAAVARIPRTGGPAAKRAELTYAAATAALATGDTGTAREHAEHAGRLFRAQHREWWAARAELVALEARYAAGETQPRLVRRAGLVAVRLAELKAPEAHRAHLLAGRVALASGRPAAAEHHLRAAAAARRRGAPLTRSGGWLAQALLANVRGQVRATLNACARGLDALDEHRITLGSMELRAHATAHGAELAKLAQRAALDRGDARGLLRWSERWRATALAVPSVRPPPDAELVGELAALRDVVRRLDASRTVGPPALERERRRLEEAVRARTLRTRAAAAGTASRLELDALLAGLGDTRLVELIDVGGVLHAVVVAGGRIRHRIAGRLPEAEREVELARFRLRWLAHGQPTSRGGPSLDQIGARLEEVLLGAAARELGDGPLVVVPPGRLHAVPWALLPALRDRVVSVAPSAAIWLRAKEIGAPAGRRVALVYGPDLGTGGAEIPELTRRYPGATVLGDGSATAERVLGALDGAWLAHVAAHGTFRSDSPLFSALRLDDGPLTVHDFERLRRAPYRLILSSCESGVAKPVGADELLGLTTGLVPLGAAGILASVVQVNDAAAVPLMLALHDRLAKEVPLAEALLGARQDTGDDPVGRATAQSFVALGA